MNSAFVKIFFKLEGCFLLSIKDVHRRQKLTTDFFFKLFELTILVVNISISRKNMLTVVSRGSFFKGLDNKS